MTYVDTLSTVLTQVKGWRWPKACHLVADSEAELLRFAKHIGLKKEWLQRGIRGLPHFDLTAGMRRKAVAHGAQEIDRNQLVDLIRKKREKEAADAAEETASG